MKSTWITRLLGQFNRLRSSKPGRRRHCRIWRSSASTSNLPVSRWRLAVEAELTLPIQNGHSRLSWKSQASNFFGCSEASRPIQLDNLRIGFVAPCLVDLLIGLAVLCALALLSSSSLELSLAHVSPWAFRLQFSS
jgi:hypothetical protein